MNIIWPLIVILGVLVIVTIMAYACLIIADRGRSNSDIEDSVDNDEHYKE